MTPCLGSISCKLISYTLRTILQRNPFYGHFPIIPNVKFMEKKWEPQYVRFTQIHVLMSYVITGCAHTGLNLKYLNIQDYLEKYLKIKFALKST